MEKFEEQKLEIISKLKEVVDDLIEGLPESIPDAAYCIGGCTALTHVLKPKAKELVWEDNSDSTISADGIQSYKIYFTKIMGILLKCYNSKGTIFFDKSYFKTLKQAKQAAQDHEQKLLEAMIA